MEFPLVGINYAGIDELQRLPEIGRKRAQDIIAYRENVKLFEDVEDLIEAGVPEKLAHLLSLHIDWSITPEFEEHEYKKNFKPFSFLILVLYIYFHFSSLFGFAKSMFIERRIYDSVAIFVFIESCLRFLIINVIFLSSWLSGLMISEKNINTLFNFTITATKSLLIILLISLLSCLFLIVRQIASSDQDATMPDVFSLLVLSAELLISIGALLVFLPLILRVSDSSLISEKWSIRLSNAGFIIGLFLLGTKLLLIETGLNFEFVFTGFCFMGLSFLIVDSIFRDQPVIDKYQHFLFEKRIGKKDVNKQKLIDWLEKELPSHENQKLLKQILNQKYPISKTKILLMFLLITLPFWVFRTIVEGNIQEKTKNLFPDLFKYLFR